MLPRMQMETIKKREGRDDTANFERESVGARWSRRSVQCLLEGRWTLLNFTVAMVVLMLAAGCTPPGPRALLKGKTLIEQGRYADAATKLETATSILSTNAQAWNYLGLAYHYSGRVSEAEKAYQRSLALDHDLSEAHYNLGCLWLEQSRPDAAKTELTAYVLRRGNSLDALLKLGSAQFHSGDLNGAEKTYNDALRLLPDNPDALNGLGLVRLQHRRATEAAQFFGRAVKQRPGYAPALLNLAIVHHQQLKDPQSALQEYRAYLALKPSPPNLEEVAATTHQLEEELNPPRLASVESKSTRTSSPPSPLSSSNPDRTGTGIGEGEHAAQVASSKPRTNTVTRTAPQPKSLPATNVVKVASPVPSPTTGKTEVVTVPAEPVFKPAEDVPLTDGGGAALVKPSNEVAAASGSGPAAAESSTGRYKYISPPKPSPGDRVAAERFLAQGASAKKPADAERAYLKAAHIDPSYFEAQFNLGAAAAQLGHQSAALSAYEYAIAINPDSADARYNFAITLKQANYPADAAHELEKLAARSSNETRAHLALGNLYAGPLNEPAKAREHYQKVLATDPRHPQASKILYWLAGNPP